jgi:hypothetical protein
MKHGAICELCGQTEVVEGNWVLEKDEKWMLSDGSEGLNLKKGNCIRPESCSYRDRCTGKVEFTIEEGKNNGKVVIYSSRWKKRSLTEFG